MKSIGKLLLALSLICSGAESKTVKCKTKFKDKLSWDYCTKFGVSPNSSAMV